MEYMITSAVSISSELYLILCWKKPSARWMPQLSTVNQKWDHVTYFKNFLQLFLQNSHVFHLHFVTVDAWIQRTIQTVDYQREVCIKKGEDRSVRMRRNNRRLLLGKSWTITVADYTCLLNRLKTELKGKVLIGR